MKKNPTLKWLVDEISRKNMSGKLALYANVNAYGLGMRGRLDGVIFTDKSMLFMITDNDHSYEDWPEKYDETYEDETYGQKVYHVIKRDDIALDDSREFQKIFDGYIEWLSKNHINLDKVSLIGCPVYWDGGVEAGDTYVEICNYVLDVRVDAIDYEYDENGEDEESDDEDLNEKENNMKKTDNLNEWVAGQDGSTPISHPKTANRADVPRSYMIIVDPESVDINDMHSHFLTPDLRLTKSVKNDDENRAFKTTDRNRLNEMIDKAMRRYPSSNIIVCFNDYSYAPMRRQNCKRFAVLDMYEPEWGWRNGGNLLEANEFGGVDPIILDLNRKISNYVGEAKQNFPCLDRYTIFKGADVIGKAPAEFTAGMNPESFYLIFKMDGQGSRETAEQLFKFLMEDKLGMPKTGASVKDEILPHQEYKQPDMGAKEPRFYGVEIRVEQPPEGMLPPPRGQKARRLGRGGRYQQGYLMEVEDNPDDSKAESIGSNAVTGAVKTAKNAVVKGVKKVAKNLKPVYADVKKAIADPAPSFQSGFEKMKYDITSGRFKDEMKRNWEDFKGDVKRGAKAATNAGKAFLKGVVNQTNDGTTAGKAGVATGKLARSFENNPSGTAKGVIQGMANTAKKVVDKASMLEEMMEEALLCGKDECSESEDLITIELECTGDPMPTTVWVKDMKKKYPSIKFSSVETDGINGNDFVNATGTREDLMQLFTQDYGGEEFDFDAYVVNDQLEEDDDMMSLDDVKTAEEVGFYEDEPVDIGLEQYKVDEEDELNQDELELFENITSKFRDYL